MSNGTVTFANKYKSVSSSHVSSKLLLRTGKFDLEVTTFQMAVLFCWENRREDKISLENLRLATGEHYQG